MDNSDYPFTVVKHFESLLLNVLSNIDTFIQVLHAGRSVHFVILYTTTMDLHLTFRNCRHFSHRYSLTYT